MTFGSTPFIHRALVKDPTFADAMAVRMEVFVNEQGVPEENERDDYDDGSIHWIVYASIPSPSNSSKNSDRDILSNGNSSLPGSRKNSEDAVNSDPEQLMSNRTPVGTIRLIPPSVSKKSYILLGRLAVLKPFRKLGLARLLVEEAMRYAEAEGAIGVFDCPRDAIRWDGKCYIHAQSVVQGWWAKQGFYLDEDAGEWDEEGIQHVGMWKDVIVERRRGSIAIL